MRALLLFVVALLAAVTVTAAPRNCAELGWVCPDPPACRDGKRRCDVCHIPDDAEGRECFCKKSKCGMEFSYLGICTCVRKPDTVQPHDEAWCEARGYVCPPKDCNVCTWPGAHHIQCRCSTFLSQASCTCVERWERELQRQRQQEV